MSDTKYKVHRADIDGERSRVVLVADFEAALAAKDAEIATLECQAGFALVRAVTAEARAELAEQEAMGLRADRDALARDFADLLVLADVTAQVEARAERLAAIQKRYLLGAARAGGE